MQPQPILGDEGMKHGTLDGRSRLCREGRNHQHASRETERARSRLQENSKLRNTRTYSIVFGPERSEATGSTPKKG